MSKNNLFDGISRILAGPISRRKAFRLIAGAVAGGTAVSLLPEPAYADDLECGDICGNPAATCAATLGTCPTGTKCIGSVLTKCLCCSDRCGLFQECCCAGEVCKGGKCVSACMGTIGRLTPLASGQIQIVVQNKDLGVAAVAIHQSRNVWSTPGLHPPLATGGTKDPVTFTFTKYDSSKSGLVDLLVTDTQGHDCKKDPIFTILKLATGKWAKQSFSGVAKRDQYLTVTNFEPSLGSLEVWVNSRLFRTLTLKPGETANFDLGAAMTDDENTISFVGYGALGSRASIMVADVEPDSESDSDRQAAGAQPAAMGEQALASRQSQIWGPLVEDTEENTDLHTADAAGQTVRLNFNGDLNSGAAGNPSIFTVKVNGKAVIVRAVQPRPGANGSSLDLTLRLPAGTLHSGDQVDVYWQGLPDGTGRPLSGHVPLLVE